MSTTMQPPPLSSILSTHDFEKAASKSLTPKTWAFYSSAATDTFTHGSNRTMYDRILLRPRILRNVTSVSTKTNILGCRMDLPLFMSPAAMATLVHPDGELALARGCARYGVGMCVSTNAAYHLSEITSAAAKQNKKDHPFFFQLYVNKDREVSRRLLRTAEENGAKAVFVTVDAPVAGKREADERVPLDPHDIRFRTPLPMSGACIGGNDEKGGGLGRSMGQYIDAGFTWEDLAWLKENTFLPIVLKGVQTAEDAILAMEYGVDGIVVSNHGGRSLDTSTSSIAVLMEIRRCCPQVFDRLEVFVDGGIRRGTDIIKAICLGAKAVVMRDELETTMKLLGITDLSQAHLGLLNTLDVDHLIPKQSASLYSEPARARL
ncbi:cytochrome b2, mitochondrial [Aspergillus awamori]|uniref:Cytochrome b2, mitochondrial n=1 Tax=Aspergillus awamori TaxID=105351 RepID=A0A401KM99_ASPAW|nr:cytochrome b2, mitochondrial [Aspergillus awamori]